MMLIRALWILVGMGCGLALALVISLSLAYLLILLGAEGGNALFVWGFLLTVALTLVGVPTGAYAGWYRGRTGSWKGVCNASSTGSSTGSARDVAQRFATFQEQVSRLPERDVAAARADYIRELQRQHDDLTPNYGLFALGILYGVCAWPLAFIPLWMAWSHRRRLRMLRNHIRGVIDVWSDKT